MKINNLSFAFSSKSSPFFQHIDMTLEPNKIYFLQGANGSGKSTLFRLLQGNVRSGEIIGGTVSVDNKIYDLRDNATRDMLHTFVHAVHQDYDTMLADQFNFEENIRFAHMPRYPSLKPLSRHQLIPAFIERFKIDLSKPVYLLSGGQRQILAMLTALQKSTALLLLDEPTAALDPVNTQTVLAFLHELVAQTAITILIISHDQTVMKEYAQPENSFEMYIDTKTGIRTLERKR